MDIIRALMTDAKVTHAHHENRGRDAPPRQLLARHVRRGLREHGSIARPRSGRTQGAKRGCCQRPDLKNACTSSQRQQPPRRRRRRHQTRASTRRPQQPPHHPQALQPPPRACCEDRRSSRAQAAVSGLSRASRATVGVTPPLRRVFLFDPDDIDDAEPLAGAEDDLLARLQRNVSEPSSDRRQSSCARSHSDCARSRVVAMTASHPPLPRAGQTQTNLACPLSFKPRARAFYLYQFPLLIGEPLGALGR